MARFQDIFGHRSDFIMDIYIEHARQETSEWNWFVTRLHEFDARRLEAIFGNRT